MNTPSSYPLTAPDILLKDIVSIDVRFFDFEGKEKTGVVEVHTLIQDDIIELFNLIYKTKFPLSSVLPISEFNGDDDASMEANNSYAFGFRTIALDPTRISLHGFGLSIDLNPKLNPYIKGEVILPPGSEYFPGNPGVFDAHHPIVIFMKKRGFVWGGDWEKPYLDYHHFQKELPESYKLKYEQEIQKVLDRGVTI